MNKLKIYLIQRIKNQKYVNSYFVLNILVCYLEGGVIQNLIILKVAHPINFHRMSYIKEGKMCLFYDKIIKLS